MKSRRKHAHRHATSEREGSIIDEEVAIPRPSNDEVVEVLSHAASELDAATGRQSSAEHENNTNEGSGSEVCLLWLGENICKLCISTGWPPPNDSREAGIKRWENSGFAYHFFRLSDGQVLPLRWQGWNSWRVLVYTLQVSKLHREECYLTILKGQWGICGKEREMTSISCWW